MAHVWQGVINEYRDRSSVRDEVKPGNSRRRRNPADSRTGAVSADWQYGIPQIRGDEPHRIFQRPWHDERYYRR